MECVETEIGEGLDDAVGGLAFSEVVRGGTASLETHETLFLALWELSSCPCMIDVKRSHENEHDNQAVKEGIHILPHLDLFPLQYPHVLDRYPRVHVSEARQPLR